MKRFGSTVMNMQNQKQSKLITTIWLILLIAIWEGSVSLFKNRTVDFTKAFCHCSRINWDERFTITKYDANTAGSYNWTILCNFIGDEHRNYYGRYTVISYFNKSIARYFANNSNCCTCTAIYYLVWIWDVAESNGRNTCLFLPNCA